MTTRTGGDRPAPKADGHGWPSATRAPGAHSVAASQPAMEGAMAHGCDSYRARRVSDGGAEPSWWRLELTAMVVMPDVTFPGVM
jgi:hypothetical protein